jgi:hypothetical protein
MKKRNGVYALVVAASMTFLVGCGKDNPAGAASEASATEDAAESIASAIGQDDGGALDQMSDVSEIASAAGIAQSAQEGKITGVSVLAKRLDSAWNPATSTWTITLERERGTANGPAYASVSRVYEYQLLNKDGKPQRSWRSRNESGGIDTAYTMTFKIVSGSGEHHTPHIAQHLNAISGQWVVTGVNTETLTINGSYSRSAVDTVTTRNATRTLDHTLSLTFTDVQVPRGNRGDLAAHATGTVAGTYNASITFSRGTSYGERTVSREFTTVLGSGNGTIAMQGKGFRALLKSGVLGD